MQINRIGINARNSHDERVAARTYTERYTCVRVRFLFLFIFFSQRLYNIISSAVRRTRNTPNYAYQRKHLETIQLARARWTRDEKTEK